MSGWEGSIQKRKFKTIYGDETLFAKNLIVGYISQVYV